MAVSNALSCYPLLSVLVGNAPANAQLVLGALCFDKSVADSPVLFAETIAPIDYSNDLHNVLVALGHLPTGYRCSLSAVYQIIGSSERSGEKFADFEIPANNTCTDQPTLLNPTFDPKTGTTNFNIGPPQCSADMYDVTAVPASGGSNVTISTQKDVVSLPLVSGTVYNNIFITAKCKDGNLVTGSYGQYSYKSTPEPPPPNPAPATPPSVSAPTKEAAGAFWTVTYLQSKSLFIALAHTTVDGLACPYNQCPYGIKAMMTSSDGGVTWQGSDGPGKGIDWRGSCRWELNPADVRSHSLTHSLTLCASLVLACSGGPPGGEVAIGLASSRVVTSKDGSQWTTTSTYPREWKSCAWSTQMNMFVVVGTGGYGDNIMTSLDGFTWTVAQNQPPSYTKSGPWKGVTYGDGKFVAVGGVSVNQPTVAYSTNGVSWTDVPNVPLGNWDGVTYGGPPGAEVFVAVSMDGPNGVMTSTDGVSWTARPSPGAIPVRSVAWGNGLFMAVSSSGSPLGMVSSDGITWVPVKDSVLDAGEWMSVVHAEGRFVGVGYGQRPNYDKNTAFYTT